MIEHGIFTIKAMVWVHLFPGEGRVYWYLASAMRELITRGKIPLTDGKSVNGKVTGRGYLIPKNAAPVYSIPVALPHTKEDWKGLTDREHGVRGEEVVKTLMAQGKLAFPFFNVESIRTKEGQIHEGDARVSPAESFTVEIKTERYDNSRSLFVQRGEGGHCPTLIRDGENTGEERHSELPELVG